MGEFKFGCMGAGLQSFHPTSQILTMIKHVSIQMELRDENNKVKLATLCLLA